MRYIPIGRRRKAAREVASPERVREVGAMNPYQGADPDEVMKRLRAMTYGSTSSAEVKRRIVQDDMAQLAMA